MQGFDSSTGVTIVLPVRCKRWTCPYCRVCNEIRIRAKVLEGKPNRMLTITARPKENDTPMSMYLRVRPCVNRFYHEIRRTFGPFEAATFLERHKSGFPHWHALVRSGFLPQSELSDIWKRISGSPIVDIRRIKQHQVAARYVSKYVVKQLTDLLNNRLGRVVTFTRAYLFEDKTNPATGIAWSFDRRHPIEVVEDSYKGWDVAWSGRTALLSPKSKKIDLKQIIAQQTTSKQNC